MLLHPTHQLHSYPEYKQRKYFNDADSAVYSSQGGHMHRQLIAVTMIILSHVVAFEDKQ